MTYRLCDPVLDKIQGPVMCQMDGTETEYESIKELTAKVFQKKYGISEIRAQQDRIVLVLTERESVPNDLSAEWAREQMGETGRGISFF